MNGDVRGPLLRALAEPGTMARLSEAQWDLVLRQARAAGVLGRLGALARDAGVDAALPGPVHRAMTAWLTVSDAQRRTVAWEMQQLAHDLADLPGPILLLKGAAYAAGDLAPARGRVFADIDLMVPGSQLGQAELGLMLGGWAVAPMSAYDQRYYRQWMHELPPMSHLRRRTSLDLHHGLLPRTARLRVRSELVFERAMPLPGQPRLSVPCPEDLVLHSAVHLMHEGEWGHGLRDLTDLDALLRQFAAGPGFWERLLARAAELGAGRPLDHALRNCSRLLGTPVPADVPAACPDRADPRVRLAIDAVLDAALGSTHPSWRTPLTPAAEFAMYVRSHWLRMPAHLLVAHLLRKAWQARVQPLFDRQAP